MDVGMNSPVVSPISSPPAGNAGGPAIELAELVRAVRAADPCALLVLPRILRRVIRQECQLTAWTLRVPHRKSYVLSRERLLEIVDQDELGLAPEAVLPETVILLPQPDSEKLAAMTAGEALLRCWRLLFHARVHASLEEASADGRLTPAIVRKRIYQLGAVEFDEIRSVLDQEAFLLPPRDEATVYVEFAAVFLELHHFAPSLLTRYFPALADHEAAGQVVAQDVDGAALFRSTRPARADVPSDVATVETGEDLPGADSSMEHAGLASWFPSEHEFRRMLRLGDSAAKVGNTVRSLIYHARALQHAAGETVAKTRIAMRAGLDQLLQRLQRALEIPQEQIGQWREPLAALVYQTTRGFWPAEARFLYDLQKVCIDHEREIYKVDLVGWIRSLGKQPLRRPLPNQREVLMSKHLHSAAARLPVVRLPATLRRRLSDLLHGTLDQVEERLRCRFRPQVTASLDAVGLRPGNVPERVARQKIVEELLDGIVERGYLAMGNFRDALSRNTLKLPDLSGPGDLLHGDRLLRGDRRLAAELDGVYRGGEFYLRWMQRLSSLAFGTHAGRWLTRFAFVPFVGAFVGMAGLEHLIGIVTHAELDLKSAWVVIPLGLFLAGLINFEGFRQRVWRGCQNLWHGTITLLVDPLVSFFRSEIVQRIFHSRAYMLASRFVVRPLVLTSIIFWVSPLQVAELTTAIRWMSPSETITGHASTTSATLVFVLVNLLINSRLGRTAEEVFVEWIVHSWQRFGLRILTGAFWWLVDLFKSILENIERLLYTVDEWVRFRAGDTRLSIAVKTMLGSIWFFVSYMVRFLVNLIIEPQINPLKHFPTVTVGHKLLLPFIPTLAGVLELTMEKGLAITTATFIITAIPGIFGFLVWELTGNWRLYTANRPEELRPVPIGSHGETMVRLLRPGFHSGTLPKRFARLRRADRKARESGNWNAVRKHLRVIEHVEKDVRRYVERGLLALLAECPVMESLCLVVGGVELGSNRVRVVLECPSLGEPLVIGWEIEAGWLLAGINRPEWLERLDASQRRILANGLTGMYKTSRVDLVRQRIRDLLPAAGVYRMSETSLLVSPTASCDVEVKYPMEGDGALVPLDPPAFDSLPVLPRADVLFGCTNIRWEDWCVAWDLSLDPTRPPPMINGTPRA
jgi:hypothetical protein